MHEQSIMVDIVFLNIYGNLGEFLSVSKSFSIKQLLLHDCKRLQKSNNKQHLQKNSNEQSLYGSWQEIPADIMGIIAQRLTVSDRIRLGMVCKSWRSLQKDICLAPQLPWLTLPHDPNKKNLVSFYDLYAGKVHNMKMPKALQGAVCWGSSKGWLIMAKERPCFFRDMIYTAKEIINVSMPSFHDIIPLITKPIPDTEIFLFNPISRALVQLPSLSAVPSYYQVVWSFKEGYNASFFIRDIELSSADTSQCIVAAVFVGCDGMVAFCRPGDKQWSIFRGNDDKEGNHIVDILFYKGTLYLLRNCEIEHVETHTFGLVDCEVSLKFIPNQRDNSIINFLHGNFGIVPECSWDWDEYLVESTNGELLLISRSLDFLLNTYNDDEGNLQLVKFIYKNTKAFEVFKMDPNTGQLSRLQSLGDQVLFLTYGGSLSCWAKDFFGVQGNCIYFVDDVDQFFYYKDPFLSRASGLYYLEDGRIERSFPSVNFPLQSRMSWFTPVL